MKSTNIVVGVMRLTLLVFYGFFSPVVVESQPSPVPIQEVSTSAPANDPTTNQEMSPFLMLGVGINLYSLPYTWPEAPNQTDALLVYTENNYYNYITAISYHYRRRLIFWSATNGRVYRGSFMNRTRLINVSYLQVLTAGFPWDQLVIGDLAVDWISDKVYWTIRDEGKIEELDLDTNLRRIVVQSEETASFNGLAIYPYPNNGWIYWTDREIGTIERVAVTGEGNQAQLVRGGLGKCIWPLEIDYSKQTLYWVNTCVDVLRSLQISDAVQSADRVEIESSFEGTSSMTLFENVLYWNEDNVVKATNKSVEMGEIVQLYQVSSLGPAVTAVELVHPGKQPQEEEFVMIINENIDEEMLNKTCPPCINGHCIPPGVCACDRGWTGDNCTTDVNECDIGSDGCDYECHNTLGSFYCSCNSTSYLDSDGRTCILDVNECDVGSDGCDYECHNTLGSFYCSCNSSSYLDSDGRTCILVTTTYVINPTVSTTDGMGIVPEETSPGDHEFTTVSITNTGPIHSRTVMASDTLLPVLSSHFAVVLPSSSVATVNIAASGTPTSDDMYRSTSQPPFSLPESSMSTSISLSEPIFPTIKSTMQSTPADSSKSFLPKSTADPTLILPKSTSAKSEPSLFPKSTSLANTHSSSTTTLSSSIISPTESSRLLATPTTSSNSFSDELHKSTSTYYISVTVSEQAIVAPSTTTSTSTPLTTTTVGLTSSFSTAVLLLPSSTSPMASLAATASPTPGLSTSSSPVLPVISSSPAPPISTSTTYATRSQFTPSSMVLGPLETPTTASETTQTDGNSSTAPPSSNGMTLIVIASTAAGACVLLIIVVIIMIAAVVHYASKRCGSYTVNPDPEKKSNGAPSWISVSVGQSSSLAPATNHYANVNGHSNGHSYRTKSFRASSPTCSTNSFT